MDGDGYVTMLMYFWSWTLHFKMMTKVYFMSHILYHTQKRQVKHTSSRSLQISMAKRNGGWGLLHGVGIKKWLFTEGGGGVVLERRGWARWPASPEVQWVYERFKFGMAGGYKMVYTEDRTSFHVATMALSKRLSCFIWVYPKLLIHTHGSENLHWKWEPSSPEKNV